jgi:hypothetical protein
MRVIDPGSSITDVLLTSKSAEGSSPGRPKTFFGANQDATPDPASQEMLSRKSMCLVPAVGFHIDGGGTVIHHKSPMMLCGNALGVGSIVTREHTPGMGSAISLDPIVRQAAMINPGLRR